MAVTKRKAISVKGKEAKNATIPFLEAKKYRYSPQIIRKITALKPVLTSTHAWRWILLILITAVLLLQLVKAGQTLYAQYNEAQAKQAEKAALEVEVVKWETIAREKPNYRDAYFELAVLTYRLNRIDESRAYLQKVFTLDPNFEPARKLEKILFSL